jgi:hypothetical protein
MVLRGGEKPLFTRKEVFPLPTPHPFSRKAEYLLREELLFCGVVIGE